MQQLDTLVVVGATSGISMAYLNLVAKNYKRIVLVARNNDRLEQVAEHHRAVSNASLVTIVSDLSDTNSHSALIEKIRDENHRIDCAFISYGLLTDQQRCKDDVDYALQQFNVNGTSVISLSSHLAATLKQQGSGTLAVVGSVAGDRGRASNYIYGAAKSAVDACLSGLRSELQRHNVHVITIKPGFVDTPMTAGFKKGALWATADKVAQDIDRAVRKKSNVLYTPWFWRYIMWVIKHIPEWIFKKLPL